MVLGEIGSVNKFMWIRMLFWCVGVFKAVFVKMRRLVAIKTLLEMILVPAFILIFKVVYLLNVGMFRGEGLS